MFVIGGRQSREIHVIVQSLPEVTAVPEVLGYRRGENLTLSCLGQGLPHPTLIWSRDGVSLTEPTDGSASQVDLHVTLATHEDEGAYTCTASSSSGTGKSRETHDHHKHSFIHLLIITKYNAAYIWFPLFGALYIFMFIPFSG